VLYDDGTYELTSWELTNRYDRGKILELVKLTPDTIVNAIHLDGATGRHFVKRFRIETSSIDQKFTYISEAEGSKLLFATTKPGPIVSLKFVRKNIEDEELNLETFIDVKGWKANGNKLSDEKIRKVDLLRWTMPAPPLAKEEDEDESEDTLENVQEDDAPDENPAPIIKDIPFEVVDAREEKKKGNEDLDDWKPTLF
jgi:topoisomerase-4 subunit A